MARQYPASGLSSCLQIVFLRGCVSAFCRDVVLSVSDEMLRWLNIFTHEWLDSSSVGTIFDFTDFCKPMLESVCVSSLMLTYANRRMALVLTVCFVVQYYIISLLHHQQSSCSFVCLHNVDGASKLAWSITQWSIFSISCKQVNLWPLTTADLPGRSRIVESTLVLRWAYFN